MSGAFVEVAYFREPSRRRRGRARGAAAACSCRLAAGGRRASTSASTPRSPSARRRAPPRRCSGAAMSAAAAVLAALAVPLAGAAADRRCSQRAPNLREAVTLATAVALFVVVLSLLPGGPRRRAAGAARCSSCSRASPFAFAVEPLGMLFALVAVRAVDRQFALLDRLHARATTSTHQTRFYVCFAVALARDHGRSPSPATCSRCSSSTRC